MTLKSHSVLFAALICGLIFVPATGLRAQKADASAQAAPAASKDSSQDPSSPDYDPRKRERSDEQKLRAKKAVRQELSSAYKNWLNEQVTYIISDEERRAFTSLSNDEERDNFIEAFWQRRNPNPDSPDNEYKEEHYRRIAYAN